MTEQKPEVKKKFDKKEYAKEYYKKHKHYFYSQVLLRRSKEIMKKILALIIMAVLFMACNGNGQPKDDYDIYGTAVTGATQYHFFLEKKTVEPYRLIQGMDYLAPSVISLKVGQASTPVFTVNLNNDGSEYKVGIVAENSAGFMAVWEQQLKRLELFASTPAGVGLRKH